MRLGRISFIPMYLRSERSWYLVVLNEYGVFVEIRPNSGRSLVRLYVLPVRVEITPNFDR